MGNVSRAEALSLATKLQSLLQEQLAAQPLYPSQMRDLRYVMYCVLPVISCTACCTARGLL